MKFNIILPYIVGINQKEGNRKLSKLTNIREMLYEAIDLWGFDDIVTKMLSQRLNEEINKEQLRINEQY